MRILTHPLHRASHLLVALLACGCHSNGTSRDAATDFAKADLAPMADASQAADIPVGADSSPLDGPPDTPSGADSTLDGGFDHPGPDGIGDSGQDGALVFQCKFPADPKIAYCSEGQYCLSIQPGAVGYDRVYSCVALPAACANNGTCECICGPGGLSNCTNPATMHCLCIPGPDGLALVCGGP